MGSTPHHSPANTNKTVTVRQSIGWTQDTQNKIETKQNKLNENAIEVNIVNPPLAYVNTNYQLKTSPFSWADWLWEFNITAQTKRLILEVPQAHTSIQECPKIIQEQKLPEKIHIEVTFLEILHITPTRSRYWIDQLQKQFHQLLLQI